MWHDAPACVDPCKCTRTLDSRRLSLAPNAKFPARWRTLGSKREPMTARQGSQQQTQAGRRCHHPHQQCRAARHRAQLTFQHSQQPPASCLEARCIPRRSRQRQHHQQPRPLRPSAFKRSASDSPDNPITVESTTRDMHDERSVRAEFGDCDCDGGGGSSVSEWVSISQLGGEIHSC